MTKFILDGLVNRKTGFWLSKQKHSVEWDLDFFLQLYLDGFVWGHEVSDMWLRYLWYFLLWLLCHNCSCFCCCDFHIMVLFCCYNCYFCFMELLFSMIATNSIILIRSLWVIVVTDRNHDRTLSSIISLFSGFLIYCQLISQSFRRMKYIKVWETRKIYYNVYVL